MKNLKPIEIIYIVMFAIALLAFIAWNVDYLLYTAPVNVGS